MTPQLRSWQDLAVTSAQVIPLSAGGDAALLLRVQERLGAIAANSAALHALAATSAKALSTALDQYLDPSLSPAPEYRDAVTSLFDAFPLLLDSPAGADIGAGIGDLTQRVSVFNDAYANKVAPTQVKAKTTKMLGEYLVDLGFVTKEKLLEALTAQKSGAAPGKRVGDILQDWGIITRAQLDAAIEQQMVDMYA